MPARNSRSAVKPAGKSPSVFSASMSLPSFATGIFPVGFEIPAADQEVIGAIDLFLFQAADLHQDADGLVTVGWRVEPSHAPVVDEAELFDRAFVGAGPIGVHRHAGERHIDVIHGIAEIVEPCRLGVEIERRRQDRGIDRAGLQSRKSRRRCARKRRVNAPGFTPFAANMRSTKIRVISLAPPTDTILPARSPMFLMPGLASSE